MASEVLPEHIQLGQGPIRRLVRRRESQEEVRGFVTNSEKLSAATDSGETVDAAGGVCGCENDHDRQAPPKGREEPFTNDDPEVD